VVVTHLNPERESLLHQIIGRQTGMPVSLAVDAEKVEPNHVYVVPADAVLSITGGRLQIRRLERGQRERKPIDIFLGSLAMDQGQWAAAVVLSGGDGDGTLGVKAVKQAGGLTLAQVGDGYGPAHPDMPDSAISTGFVDFAVPVAEMGEKLCDFARELKTLDDEAADLEAARPEICGLLRDQTAHEFNGYKPKTFLRRVQRRMAVTKTGTPNQYVERLRRDPQEVTALFRDLLIKVTTFFRDPEAFEALQQVVIPKLFEGKEPQDAVRVWIPGCSTGEEAYSVAILLREHMDNMQLAPRIQVFATDLDEQALAVARAGRYPEALLDGVSAERRRRFFVTGAGSCTVAKEVREMCIFSPHNVAADPPFSHIDLVSCRNLLIYFGSILQKQVIPNFHYSLWPRGYLFLGMSESAREFGGLFAPLDKAHRIFRCREEASPRVRMPNARRGAASIPPIEQLRLSPDLAGVSALRNLVEQQVLARHAPAFVVATRDGEAVHFSAGVGRYLEPPPGAPSRQIMAMARKDLRLDLRDAFRQALQSDRRVMRKVAWHGPDGSAQSLSLTIERVSDRQGEPLYLVLFDEDAAPAPAPARRTDGPATRVDEQAERQLQETRDRLHATVEEYETALEELRSSNEELVSLNEELQSSNEELEATKEETHSLNEELHTVNAELNRKVDSLDRANSDLQNLFDSTDIALVFLDRQLKIRSFTPAATRLFNILPSDKGRPLTDLSASAALPQLAEDVPQVFTSGEMIERRVQQAGGEAHFLVRLAPYRDGQGRVVGVVISIVDVTTLARAEAHQRVLTAELQHRVRNILATLRSLTRRTLRGAASIEEAESHLIGRLDNLARTQSLLTRHVAGDLETLLRDELQAQAADEDRVSISGPQVELSPKLVELLTLVFHELATNAIKYGAIGQSDGRIAVSWRMTERPGRNTWLDLTWQETGVQVAGLTPVRKGFGTELITRRIPYELNGRAALDLQPGGLRAHLEFPLASGESLLSTTAPAPQQER
jgi:two-component system CheB/CheR fusion protein